MPRHKARQLSCEGSCKPVEQAAAGAAAGRTASSSLVLAEGSVGDALRSWAALGALVAAEVG